MLWYKGSGSVKSHSFMVITGFLSGQNTIRKKATCSYMTRFLDNDYKRAMCVTSESDIKGNGSPPLFSSSHCLEVVMMKRLATRGLSQSQKQQEGLAVMNSENSLHYR